MIAFSIAAISIFAAVYEFAEYAGQYYLCMEFLAGGTLATRLAGKGLPLREAALIVRDLASAIQAAHDQRIIHRSAKFFPGIGIENV